MENYKNDDHVFLCGGKIVKLNESQEHWLADQTVDRASLTAVLNILPDEFRNIIESGKFDKSLLETVKGGIYEVPLYYVTKAFDILLHGEMTPYECIMCCEDGQDDEELVREESSCCTNFRRYSEAVRQNNEMKRLWKEHFGIDIDTLEIDFSRYNAHFGNNVTEEDEYLYFVDVPDGLEEYILHAINHPDVKIWYCQVSDIMELTAYELHWRGEY